GLDSRLRGNDESIRTETCTTSFLRTYIPSFPQGQKTKIRNLKSRHSHESGNLEMKSNRHLSEITETEQTRFPPARE
ncbi:hypothetical protein, partial [Neisseria meningitidis]|uniref:hypothetical protein n=1 Tax=Neisseria meningitidis TaxID=487 RepID=UPI000E5792AF